MRPLIDRTISMRDPNSFDDIVISEKIYHYQKVEPATKFKKVLLPKSYEWDEFKLYLPLEVTKAEVYRSLDLYEVFRCFVVKEGFRFPFYARDRYSVLTDDTLATLRTTIGYASHAPLST